MTDNLLHVLIILNVGHRVNLGVYRKVTLRRSLDFFHYQFYDKRLSLSRNLAMWLKRAPVHI